MKLKPQALLETFGVDQEQPGAQRWLRLVYSVALGRGVGAAAREIAAADGITLRVLYGTMRRDLAPVLEADPEALSYFEVPLKERTSTELARVVAAYL